MTHNAQIGNRPMQGVQYAQSASTLGNCENEPQRQVQVSQHMQRLQLAIDENQQMVSHLSERLLAVLTNQVPMACSIGVQEVRQELVPLAGAIESATQRLENNNATMAGLLQRLEI